MTVVDRWVCQARCDHVRTSGSTGSSDFFLVLRNWVTMNDARPRCLYSPSVHPMWPDVSRILGIAAVEDYTGIPILEFRELLCRLHSSFWREDSRQKFDDVPTMFASLPAEVVQQFLKKTLPRLCQMLVSRLPEVHSFPWLPQMSPATISYKPVDAFLLIGASFLCLPLMSEDGEVPRMYGTCHLFFTNRPHICAKLHCILNYLNIMMAAISGETSDEIKQALLNENRFIEIERLVCNPSYMSEDWGADQSSLSEIEYKDLFDRIECSREAVHADFANKSLGGGVLRRGCVQEEIRFIISPETLLSVLLCERMGENEAVIVRNTIIFNDYSGYSSSFRCRGFSKDLVSLMSGTSLTVHLDDILAIDAIPFGNDKHKQFHMAPLLRELTKCRAGLSYPGAKPFATGNWGCGVYGGDTQLKAVIQWLAASSCHKRLLFYPFDDKRTAKLPMLVTHARSRGLTVGHIFRLLVKGLTIGFIREDSCIDFLIKSVAGPT